MPAIVIITSTTHGNPKAVLCPGDALVEDYRAFQKRIGTSRNVVVTPSTYGVDNRVTLDAVAAFGRRRAPSWSSTTRCRMLT